MGGWIYTQLNKCPNCGYEGRICKEPEILGGRYFVNCMMQNCSDFFYMPSKKLGVAIVNWNRHTKGRNDFISDLDIDLMKDKIRKNSSEKCDKTYKKSLEKCERKD